MAKGKNGERSPNLCGRPLRDFELIKQDAATNNITRLGKFGDIDEDTGSAKMKIKDFTYTIEKFGEVGSFRPSTIQLFNAIRIKFVMDGAQSRTVRIPIAQYMEMRELKDRKTAVEAARKDLDVLASLKIYDTTGKTRYDRINIATRASIPKNGRSIEYSFSPEVFDIIKGKSCMLLPTELLKLNSHKFPHSIALLEKISELKHLNRGKPNEDIISVRSLIDSCPSLPTYQEVKRSGRHFKSDIIEPFIKNMNALSNVLKWSFCFSKEQPLSENETANLTYDLFSQLNVRIAWNNYPALAILESSPCKNRTTKRKSEVALAG